MTPRARRALLVALLLVLVALIAALLVTYGPIPPPPPSPTPVFTLSGRIVVSLPRAGERRAQSEGIANAVRVAVAGANGRVTAGDTTVSVEVDLVDSAGPDGAWSEAAELANIQRAANDPSVVAYIGPGTLDGAKLVAPVAAKANLLVVTPTLTHPALTRHGYDDALFAALHPGGATVFVRTIPSDEVAAKAMLRWAADRTLTPVSASGDDPWSKAFLAAASARSLVSEVSPRFIYLGGTPAERAGDRAAQERRARPGASLGGAESLLSDAFLQRAGAAAEGTVASFAGRPNEQYLGNAGTFFRTYREAYLTTPDPYAIFGYDAARLVLDALGRSRQGASVDRGKVRGAAFATKDLNGALGKWSVGPDGETTYATLQLYAVKALPGGRFAWVWDSEITP